MMKLITILLTLLASSAFCFEDIGIASHYSVKTNRGVTTKSGIPLNDKAFTAAHPTLAMGTMVKVTNLSNKKSVIVKITDRGPFIKGRIIDVSQAAAHELDFVKKGLTKVKISVIKN
jgi:rare lipoprotein A